MSILLQVEPVQLEGRLSDKNYYGFRVTHLKPAHCNVEYVVCGCDALYPGNDAMRAFINKAQLRTDRVRSALEFAEGFLSGFEDDTDQYGVAEMLRDIRDLLEELK